MNLQHFKIVDKYKLQTATNETVLTL